MTKVTKFGGILDGYKRKVGSTDCSDRNKDYICFLQEPFREIGRRSGVSERRGATPVSASDSQYSVTVLVMKRLLFVSFALWGMFGPAQSHGQSLSFQPGEELTYTASYSAAVLTTDVATVTFRTTTDQVEGIPCYRIWARGVTRPFYSVFFKMDDVYETWLEQSSLRPLVATSDLKEGSYRYRSRMQFNWKSGLVYTYGKNLKRGYEKGRTMSVTGADLDPVSHFFNLRCLGALSQMKSGQKGRLNLVMVDTIRTVEYKFLGREIIETPATGPVRCLKFTCQLAPDDAQSFQEGTDFFIWLSDDQNRIPVYLETPIRVGRAFATLTDWQNLAHPFSSRIRQ